MESSPWAGSTDPLRKKNWLIRQVQSRKRSRSSTGNPAISAMTIAGRAKARSPTSSVRPTPSMAGRASTASIISSTCAWIRSRRLSTRRGVKADATIPRTRRVVRWIQLRDPDPEVLVQRAEAFVREPRRHFDDPRHPLGASEASGVPDGRVDVGPAGHQPAVPGWGPVQRRLLTKAREDRVRVRKECRGHEERVEVRGAGDGHPGIFA